MKLLRLPEISERTGLACSTLRKLKCLQGQGKPTGYRPLPFRKLGRLLVMDEQDLEAWLEAELAT